MFSENVNFESFPMPSMSRDDGNSSSRGGAFRRFGVLEADLNVDFDEPNRALLVTKLLELCALDSRGSLPDGYFRLLSAGKRVEFLAALAAEGREPAFGFVFKCANCDEEIELEIELAEISEIQREADAVITIRVEYEGSSFDLRKPLGADLESWGGIVATTESEAARLMIGSLASDAALVDSIPPAAIPGIEDALDEVDPLVNFHCRTECGECGGENDFDVDLVEAALAKLRSAQARLIFDVHRLASHYHWTEREIFAVPDRRRRRYLELIAASRR